MKKSQLITAAVLLAIVAGLVVWGWQRIHFDVQVFRSQLALADWRLIGLGFVCIGLAYLFRSIRWALLIKPHKKVGPFSLLGTQVMGFTAVALIGRVADPVRPYLVSKKTGLPLSSQVAVYIVERLFDAGAMALIFSSAILLAPEGSLPHAQIVKRAGEWGLLLTMAGALFLVLVKMAGGVVASFLEKALAPLSKTLGHTMGHKVRTFRAGLDTLRTVRDFATTCALSLVMWLLISTAYLATMRAFVASAELAAMTLPKATLLMAFSGGASIFQLPVLGWFTQIGVVAAAMASFYGAGTEASTACAAMLLVVTFLGIAPVGLIWAQIEHVSLRKVTVESGEAQEALPENQTEAPEWGE